jgi:hypothetical protein
MVATEAVAMGDLRVLKAMEKAGHIILHADTGQQVGHWTGRTVKACYIDDIPKDRPRQFEFEDQQWELQYADGCFMPFVCLVDRGKLGFV